MRIERVLDKAQRRRQRRVEAFMRHLAAPATDQAEADRLDRVVEATHLVNVIETLGEPEGMKRILWGNR
jgi:hypothetical protein